jgi:tight adherence protein C
MNPFTLVLTSFALVAGITFVVGYVLLQRVPSVGQGRLRPGARDPEAGSPTSILRWGDELGSSWQRIAVRLGRSLGPGDPNRRLQYRRRLLWAGYTDPRAVTIFMGAKIGIALAGALAYPVYGALVARILPNTLMVTVVLAGIGFFIPDAWLARRMRARQTVIVQALPDVLDLLMVCVEGGLGFDAAVARIADRPDRSRNALHEDLMRMHLEIRAGRPREDALRDLGERTGVEQVRRVVTAFIQAERLGTPLGKTLRVHAESARVERRHRAEERAYLAPLKMIFPTAVFLMPAFMLVAMGPSLVNLLQLFQSLGGGAK